MCPAQCTLNVLGFCVPNAGALGVPPGVVVKKERGAVSATDEQRKPARLGLKIGEPSPIWCRLP